MFFGTSNDSEFLRDRTGNRRFWPVEVGIVKPKKSIWENLDNEVDQIWAEAYTNYIIGTDLFLTGEALKIAEQKQEEHKVVNVKEGIILEFLEKEVPEDWRLWDEERRMLFHSGAYKSGIKLVPRDTVCAVEILVECFGMKKGYIKNSDSMEINGIMENMKGWERIKHPLKYGSYGKQRGFKKIKI